MTPAVELTRPGAASSANADAGRFGTPPSSAASPATGGRRMAAEQALVAGGQLTAGVGNLVFALVAARLLEPRGFAQLAAFLALYLLVHVPAGSMSAGTALMPELAARARRRAVTFGGIAGALVALGSVPLSALAGVPVLLLLVLATAIPAAAWLALERGRLYGTGAHRRVAASLVVEPAVRLAAGIPLVLAGGAVGGAIAIVLGGVAAIAVTRPFGPAAKAVAAGSGAVAQASASLRVAVWPMLAFLALAIVQNQDVVLANGALDAEQAARFAVLSTIGGVAAFATTTVPLVLLPRAARGERHALAAAIGTTVVLGAAAVGVVALIPDRLVGVAFGERYTAVGELVVPYVAAMAMFGIARVLIAYRAAQGGRAPLVAVLAMVVVAQSAAILVLGDDAASVASVTLLATTALVVTAAGANLLPRLARPATTLDAGQPAPAMDDDERAGRWRQVLVVSALVVVGLLVRLVSTRGIWLDEATSILQAQMSLGGLLESLKATDVHPPLHHLLLWSIAHLTGSTSELAMRAPSIVAGTALIPAVYLLGRELYDRRAATMAAALATFAPFLVWYSQEARMYALFMLLASLAVLGQLRIMRRGTRGDWALWAVATALLLWTQYFGILLVATQQAGFAVAAYGLWRSGGQVRGFVLRWLGFTALVALAFSPLVTFALEQFQNNQSAGKGFAAPKQAGDVAAGDEVGVYAALTNLVWAMLGYHSTSVMAALTSLWPFTMLAVLLALGRRGRPLTLYIVACALLPAVVLFGLGQLKPFLFEVRFFSAAVPLLLVVVARAATGWARGRAATTATVVLLLGALGAGIADQQFNGSNPRVYDFEGALAEVKRDGRPGDVVLYQPQYLDDVVRYYAPELRSAPLEDGVPRRKDAGRVWLVASFQDVAGSRQATHRGLEVLKRDFRLVRTSKRPQLQTWLFDKESTR